MFPRITILAGLVALSALPAAAQQAAQQPSSPPPPASAGQQHPSTSGSPGSPAMQQQVRQDLEQAGFKDVQVMPESFLVRAKDKAGRPVMMVINPDSITTITALPSSAGSSTGAGSGSGNTGSTSKP